MDREELRKLRERAELTAGLHGPPNPYGWAKAVALGTLALLDELTARDAAIEKVSELHFEHDDGPGAVVAYTICDHCEHRWPCLTARALSVLDSEETP